MQRKATKNTRAANADEKRFMAWVKEQPCCICHTPVPSIVDHMYGATFKHNKVLIGMWALLPYCPTCDEVKTLGSHNKHLEVFGMTQAQIYIKFIINSPIQPHYEVLAAIEGWGR